MMDLEISPDNRFIAAYTNNSQTVLLNALVSEFIVIENPLENNQTVQGIRLLDTYLIIFGQSAWSLLNLSGKVIRTTKNTRDDAILEMEMLSDSDYSIIYWSGDLANTVMALETFKDETVGQTLDFHTVIVLNKDQTKVWVCPLEYGETFDTTVFDIVMYEHNDSAWHVAKTYDSNPYPLLQLKLSTEERYVVGTFMTGFLLWSAKKEEPDKDSVAFGKPKNISQVGIMPQKKKPLRKAKWKFQDESLPSLVNDGILRALVISWNMHGKNPPHNIESLTHSSDILHH